MAKQLLGKEVTAALNERIKGNVADLQSKRRKSYTLHYPCRRESK